MKISKPLRAMGILFIAALTLSCNLLRGPENNVVLPYEVYVGKEPIPGQMTVPKGTPPNIFVTNLIACVENNHTPGCSEGDIPIEGLPVEATYTRTRPRELQISAKKYLVTGNNGTVTDLEQLGDILQIIRSGSIESGRKAKLIGDRNFKYPDYILIQTEGGEQRKCFSKFYFGDIDYFEKPSYENFELIYDDCFPTQRTMNGREGL